MRTSGAIVVSVVSVALLQTLLVSDSGFLIRIIAISKGNVWIPLLMMVGLSGFAVYVGVYVGLRVVKNGNPRITCGVNASISILGGFASVSSAGRHKHASIFALVSILSSIAGLIGGWIAKR